MFGTRRPFPTPAVTYVMLHYVCTYILTYVRLITYTRRPTQRYSYLHGHVTVCAVKSMTTITMSFSCYSERRMRIVGRLLGYCMSGAVRTKSDVFTTGKRHTIMEQPV